MKYIALLIILVNIAFTGIAQNFSESYRATYLYKYTTDSINSYMVDDIIHLELNGNQSFCYSKYTWRLDSLTSNPQGEKIFEELLTASLLRDGAKSRSFPHRRSSFLISKNLQTNKLCVKDNLGGDYYLYQDSISDFKWDISSETKSIGSYSVIMAKCVYHGREWIAWFCPELPWHDGPWKFCALPGLIIEVYDKNNLFNFKLENISYCHNPIADWVTTFTPTERLKFNKNKYTYYKRNNTWLNNESSQSTPIISDTRYLEGLEPDFKH